MTLLSCMQRSRRVFVRRIMPVALCAAFMHIGVTHTSVLAGQTSSPAAPSPYPSPSTKKDGPGITEDELKQQLAGKFFYLRNGYFENTVRFNDFGTVEGASPTASYTLSLIKVEKVRLARRWLQIEGIRYGLHFQDEGATEDAVASADKVRITPRKKVVTILIDRAPVERPKKQKTPKRSKTKIVTPPATADQAPLPPTDTAIAQSATDGFLTQAGANQRLKQAIDAVLSPGLDERMIASMPDYWRLYFGATGEKAEYRPTDATVPRQNVVDRKARLLSTFEPPSNDLAQNAGVAGLAVYHVVISPDGRPTEIAVARPIGFGLDENAVDSIRKATFEPAMKDGKSVSVLLDLLVQFRIYSDRTHPAIGAETNAATGAATALPGPYSARQP